MHPDDNSVERLASPRDSGWYSLSWSEWERLADAIKAYEALCPDLPGLYRVGDEASDLLLYVGEGKSLLNRLRNLNKAIEYHQRGRPPGPPHVAGACVASRTSSSDNLWVSWVVVTDVDFRERRGLECELIAAHRLYGGKSPICQFGGGRS